MSSYVDIAQLVVSIATGEQALDAYREHRKTLVDSADESLVRAKERFKAEKKIREKIPEAYSWLCNTPEYQRCESRAAKTRVRNMQSQYRTAQETAVAAAGRGLIGMRRRLAREATVGFIQKTTIDFDILRQIEHSIEKQYQNLRDESIIGSTDGVQQYDASQAIARANVGTKALLDTAADQFNAAASVFGVSAGNLYNSFQNREAEPTPGSKASDYSPDKIEAFNKANSSGTDPLN